MKPKKTTISPGTHTVLLQGRSGWVVGLRWVAEAEARTFLRREKRGDTHKVQTGSKPDRLMGFARPGHVRYGIRLYALAVAFLQREGGNSYGIYQLDPKNDRWLFLASVRGQLSVMGDVVGSAREVETARDRFLEFNEPDDVQTGWHCSATPEQAVSWQTLTRALSRQEQHAARLREIPSVSKIGALAVLAIVLAAGLWYWRNDAMLEAQRTAALAALRARQAMTSGKPVVSTRTAHPWARLLPSSVFLNQCWFTREPLPVSVAGWRLTAGVCQQVGLRLRYVATAGSTVTDFARRALQLFGQSAQFDLQDGGQNGDVLIPFTAITDPSSWRDEAVPTKDEQLMRFISHLQRRNIHVQFTEIQPPAVLPGATKTSSGQDWREFTFTVNSRLAPEWLLAGCDDTGLRLASMAFTLSPQGQFDYTIKGSLYAQR
jgi:hypothetical protein